MQNLIQNTFTKQRNNFISYITAADGGLDYTLDVAKALIDNGVDLLEIGVPFTDPIADGPVIQQAMQRALTNNISLFDILDLCRAIKKYASIPIVLFSYYNPIYALRNQQFYQQASAAGVDGLLIVDLPLNEAHVHHQHCIQANLTPIYVITPNTELSRLKAIDQHSHGFLYYACRKGTTGIKNQLPDDFPERMAFIKENVNNPVIAGFGISNATDARTVLEYADGFVVGSYFVKAIAEGATAAQVGQLAKQLSKAKG